MLGCASHYYKFPAQLHYDYRAINSKWPLQQPILLHIVLIQGFILIIDTIVVITVRILQIVQGIKVSRFLRINW